jgi:LacI family transcriptional regulator
MSRQQSNKRATLATVAERAGVSVTTVSVILSGRPELLRRYRADTIDKVRRTADRLKYRANLFATGLPLKRSPFFVLVLPAFEGRSLGMPHLLGYESSLLAGVISTGKERGLYPITTSISRQTNEAEIRQIETIIDGGMSGTIVHTPHPLFEKSLCPRFQAGYPIVAIFPARLDRWETNAIDVDNAAAGRTAARLLAAHGRKDWLLVRFERVVDAEELRCQSFLSAAREAGAGVKTIRLPVGLNDSQTCDFMVARLKQVQMDAVYGPGFVPAAGTLAACVRIGLRPQQDFDLVGCDCVGWHRPDLPAITSVDISWEEVGAQAVTQLAKMIDSDTSQFKTVLLEPRVVAGGTCPVPASFNPQQI